MRLGFVIMFALPLMAVGCSSQPTKPDTSTKAQAASTAPTTEKAATKTASDSKVTCTRGKDSRMLEVQAKSKGCDLAYTKFGKEKTVASSSHDLGYCHKVMKRIEGKLKTAKFVCQ